MRLPNLKKWLKKPAVIASIAGLVLLCGLAASLHGLLDRQVQDSILRNAEIKAQNWSERFFRIVPNAEQMFVPGTPTPEGMPRLVDSFAMVDILRFELFDPEGRQTFISDRSDIERDEPSNPTALEVYRTGQPKFFAFHNDDDEHAGEPNTFVEAYVPAIAPSGERVGTMEVYVDVSPLEQALEDAFRQISWFLVVGTTIILAIPAAAYVLRTQQLRSRDQRLLELTRYDQLTGVLNRNSISDILETTFESADTSAGLGVLFVDVDFFKQVNDRFGHACGDRLLLHIAGILKASTRNEEDIVGRFGGDEFVVLCRDISRKEFRKLYGRVMEGAKTPCSHEGQSYTPSLSVGAYLTGEDDTRKTALHRADLAVYAAKRGGRGQVVEYSGELESLFKPEDARKSA